MSDQYTFTWSSSTKPSFVVLPQTSDSTTTALTLTGRGSPNWGQQLQENMLWLLESFASTTAPAIATTGQLWYDTAHQKLNVYDASLVGSPGGPWKAAAGGVTALATTPSNSQIGDMWYNTATGVLSIWDGTNWDQVFPNLSSVKVAFVTEYNSMADSINTIIGSPQGATLINAYGWNQTSATIVHETVTSLTNAKWLSLLAMVTKICNFLGQSVAGVSTTGFIYETGNTIPIGITTMLSQYTSTLATIANWSTGTVRFKPTLASLESTTPASGTQTRSTSWQGTVSHEVIATFPDANTMSAYFNSGGQFQFIPSLSGPLTGRDYDLQAFLAARGTIAFSVTGTVDSANNTNSVGFYNLTNAYQTIFSFAGSVSDPYGQPKVQINAKLDSATVLHFQIQYTDTGTLYNGVGGTLHSQTNLVRAASSIWASPTIAYPALTQTAIA